MAIGIWFALFKWPQFNIYPLKQISQGIILIYSLLILGIIIKNIISLFNKNLRLLNQVNRKLKKFIKINKLVDIVKTKEGFEKILYCPLVTYQLRNDVLVISFRLDGSPRSNSYCNLQNQLQGMIKLKCTKVDVGIGWCRYEFRTKKVEQLNINDVINNEQAHLRKDTIDINSELKWNFRKAPHGLVAGITGAGKTFFLAYLIRMYLSFGADVKIIDPKRSDMSFLEKYLGNKVVYNTPDIVELLQQTLAKMEARFDEFKKRPDYAFGKDYYDYGYDADVIVFDELMAFMGGSAEAEDKKIVMKCLMELIAKGRQAGFFVILTTQRSDTKFIPGPLRDQLGLRVGLGKMSVDGYKMVFGPGYNLKLTESTKGAGYIFIDGVTENPTEFNAPYLAPDYDFIKDIEELTTAINNELNEPNEDNEDNEDNDNQEIVRACITKRDPAEIIDLDNYVNFDFDDLID